MSPAWRPAFSAGLSRKTPTIMRQLVFGRVHLGADADVRAGQRAVAGRSLLGRHEVGVAGVADRIGQATDRAPGELLVVELVGRDVLLVDRVPGFLDEGELVAGLERRLRCCRGSCGRRNVDAADPDADTERGDERGGQDRRLAKAPDAAARGCGQARAALRAPDRRSWGRG